MSKKNCSKNVISVNDVANAETKQTLQSGKVEKYPYTTKDGRKAVYFGEINDGKPIGVGELFFKNGTKYQGPFDNGIRKGEGKMTFADGTIYQGKFDDDHMTFGSARTLDGRGFTGEWYDDFNGYGTTIWQDGVTKYEGEWQNFRSHGYGKMYYSDGTRYEGEWQNGQRSYGTFYFKDGSTYKGEWKDDDIEGDGIYTFPNGEQLEGSFGYSEWGDEGYKLDRIRGKTTYQDGSKYEGGLKFGERKGNGTMYYSDGSRYEGEWYFDRRDGYGTMYYSDGSRYEGKWSSDKRDGYGIMYYSDGSRYEGEWSSNKKNGMGKLYRPNGKLKTEGKFSYDKFVRDWSWGPLIMVIVSILSIILPVVLMW